MVDWAAARAFTEQSCAAIFDVTACVMRARRPSNDVNRPPEDDETRADFPFLGNIDLQPSGELLARHRSVDPGSSATNPVFAAVLTADTSGWPWRPRKDDRVISGSQVWVIAASGEDGSRRPAYYLVRA